jgi:hypothetical protein
MYHQNRHIVRLQLHRILCVYATQIPIRPRIRHMEAASAATFLQLGDLTPHRGASSIGILAVQHQDEGPAL